MVGLPLPNDKIRWFLAVAVVAFLWTAPLQIRALAEDNVFQKAVNYVFTGRIDPPDAPEILDQKSCVVVVPNPNFKRYVRYYLSRFRMDTALIDKTYSGSETIYSLNVKGDENIVEYLDLDKRTVLHGHKTAQISLPGDINQTNKALQLIFAEHCKADKPKTPF